MIPPPPPLGLVLLYNWSSLEPLYTAALELVWVDAGKRERGGGKRNNIIMIPLSTRHGSHSGGGMLNRHKLFN